MSEPFASGEPRGRARARRRRRIFTAQSAIGPRARGMVRTVRAARALVARNVSAQCKFHGESHGVRDINKETSPYQGIRASTTGMTQPDSMFERYGGLPFVTRFVLGFYDRVLAS